MKKRTEDVFAYLGQTVICVIHKSNAASACIDNKSLNGIQSRMNSKFAAAVCSNIVIASVSIRYSNDCHIIPKKFTRSILPNLVDFFVGIILPGYNFRCHPTLLSHNAEVCTERTDIIIVTDQDIAGIRLDEEITIIYVLIAVTVIVQFSKSIDLCMYYLLMVPRNLRQSGWKRILEMPLMPRFGPL